MVQSPNPWNRDDILLPRTEPSPQAITHYRLPFRPPFRTPFLPPFKR